MTIFGRDRKCGGITLHETHFQSITDVKKFLVENMGDRMDRIGVPEDWFGGTEKQLRAGLERGFLDMVREAEALLDKVNTGLDLEMLAPRYEYSVAGGSVSVGRFLGGSPSCMARMTEVEGEHAPVRMLVGAACSAGVKAEDMQKRAAACIALALALSRVRPVELWTYTLVYAGSASSPGHAAQLVMTRVGTSPLDMAAATCIMSINFSRRFCYHVALHNAKARHADLSWVGVPEAVAVGATADDIVTPQPRDYSTLEMAKDPVKWVDEQLRKALKGEGLAHHSGY